MKAGDGAERESRPDAGTVLAVKRRIEGAQVGCGDLRPAQERHVAREQAAIEIDHPFDDDLKMLAWSDEELNGEGFVDWYPYDHPQLGPVELGGWNTAYCLRNPPPHLLEAEVAPHADWAIWHVLISPLLQVRGAARLWMTARRRTTPEPVA